jgi:hypothetical protein
MTKKHFLIPVIVLSVVFTSCGNGEQKAANSSQSEQSSKISASQFKSCFEAYAYDFEKILTKEQVSRYMAPAYHDQIKVDVRKMQSSMGHVEYRYPSTRTHSVKAGGRTMEVPDPNIIMFKGLTFSKTDEEKTLTAFEMKYKKLSDEEFQQMSANMEKQFAGRPKEQLEQALKMLEVRKNFNTTVVEGLGTLAYWKSFQVNGNSFGVELMVLAGTVEFTIQVKIDEDDTKNAQTAIALAKEVLAKCK